MLAPDNQFYLAEFQSSLNDLSWWRRSWDLFWLPYNLRTILAEPTTDPIQDLFTLCKSYKNLWFFQRWICLSPNLLDNSEVMQAYRKLEKEQLLTEEDGEQNFATIAKSKDPIVAADVLCTLKQWNLLDGDLSTKLREVIAGQSNPRPYLNILKVFNDEDIFYWPGYDTDVSFKQKICILIWNSEKPLHMASALKLLSGYRWTKDPQHMFTALEHSSHPAQTAALLVTITDILDKENVDKIATHPAPESLKVHFTSIFNLCANYDKKELFNWLLKYPNPTIPVQILTSILNVIRQNITRKTLDIIDIFLSSSEVKHGSISLISAILKSDSSIFPHAFANAALIFSHDHPELVFNIQENLINSGCSLDLGTTIKFPNLSGIAAVLQRLADVHLDTDLRVLMDVPFMLAHKEPLSMWKAYEKFQQSGLGASKEATRNKEIMLAHHDPEVVAAVLSKLYIVNPALLEGSMGRANRDVIARQSLFFLDKSAIEIFYGHIAEETGMFSTTAKPEELHGLYNGLTSIYLPSKIFTRPAEYIQSLLQCFPKGTTLYMDEKKFDNPEEQKAFIKMLTQAGKHLTIIGHSPSHMAKIPDGEADGDYYTSTMKTSAMMLFSVAKRLNVSSDTVAINTDVVDLIREFVFS